MAESDKAAVSTAGVARATFKTRARTVDHLGRGQIADAPTAVSELWKNAWDAYSSSVSLDIFDGDPVVAAVFDAGIGMSERDFLDRWLVIGTESKVEGPAPPPPPFFQGKARPRQGEKGIGRLSTAFLAPATLVVSKQLKGPFAAILLDWRLFENPFLSLDEIVLPVRTFAGPADILEGLPGMVDVLLNNLGTRGEDGARELKDEWSRFNEQNAARPANAILQFWEKQPLRRRHLEEWPVFVGVEDHGTALFLLAAHHELSVWTRSSHEDEEVKAAKQRLMDILTGFTDALSEEPVQFDYEVLVHQGKASRRVLSSSDVFDVSDFRDLEHTVEGGFEEDGTFRGRVRAFGKDLGERVVPPARPLPASGRPGPFKFAIGTFEQVAGSSTHSARRHKELQERVARYGGVRVYRDDLRVMPYGSVDADFFGLEEQRQKHAGRYFWAHRRSFGRLAFTRQDNPLLRDKAGREGLVENQASRQLRLLVQGVLLSLALEHFGTNAPERAERIAEAQKRNLKAKKAADQARKRRRSAFRAYLNDAVAKLPEVVERVRQLSDEIGDFREPSRQGLALVRGELERARADITALAPAEVPSNLGELETRYRAFRDGLDEAGDLLALSEEGLRAQEAAFGSSSPLEVARAARDRHREALIAQLDEYQAQIRDAVKTLVGIWTSNLGDDRERYERATAPLLKKPPSEKELPDLLTMLDSNRRELEEEFSDRYGSVVRNIGSIADGIDVQSALALVDDDREDLDRRLRDLNAVAQLGITVEIIGHELEALDSEVTRSLEKLPDQAKSTDAYRRANHAHRSLTEKLRFLSPLQLAGARIREQITGQSIYDYVRDFFGTIFSDNGIRFEAGEAFLGLQFTELRSRIFPVFVNLVNNAVYWVARSDERVIRLDLVDGVVVVADTGPGVDKDDVGRLFQLFYTRRPSGRGVGLYLCRVNLEAGRHSIRYAAPEDPHVLSGANFVIEFRGLKDDH